jgi:putative membrane protein
MLFVKMGMGNTRLIILNALQMKKLSLIAIACMAAFAFQACNDNSTDAVKSANETNEVKQDSAQHTGNNSAASTPVNEDDSKFAVKAASGGMMEVQLGELAQQKASSPRVKAFGAMMVRDHTKANDELKSLAGMKNITLPPSPGEDHMDHIKNLSKKSGKEFDKDYMKMMVDDHKDDIDAFEKAGNNGKDADIKAFASKTLPVLRTHLDSAKAVRDAMK